MIVSLKNVHMFCMTGKLKKIFFTFSVRLRHEVQISLYSVYEL